MRNPRPALWCPIAVTLTRKTGCHSCSGTCLPPPCTHTQGHTGASAPYPPHCAQPDQLALPWTLPGLGVLGHCLCPNTARPPPREPPPQLGPDHPPALSNSSLSCVPPAICVPGTQAYARHRPGASRPGSTRQCSCCCYRGHSVISVFEGLPRDSPGEPLDT